jgi:hypothetical protein
MHPVARISAWLPANVNLARPIGEQVVCPGVAIVPEDIEQGMRLTVKQQQDLIVGAEPIKCLYGALHGFRRLQVTPINNDDHEAASLCAIELPISVPPSALSHMG